MESAAFQERQGELHIALGEDTRGMAFILDLARQSHLLITGTTGSGKSISVRSILACLLLTHTPDTLRLLLADPTIVELSPFNYIPHLLAPVATETSQLDNILFWANQEMKRRYSLLSMTRRLNFSGFNTQLVKRGERPLPRIVIGIDGIAGFIDYESYETGNRLKQLAQQGHSVGIHLLVTTQSVQVPGLGYGWPFNFPTRIAMATASKLENSSVFIPPTADRVFGIGEMLLQTSNSAAPIHIQSAYVGEEEIGDIIRYWRSTQIKHY
jgi:S-DNA-T family DNA segregation ATPase FtsK/SpoIIIE